MRYLPVARPAAAALAVAVCVAGLSSCGGWGGTGGKSSQVAVKVNKDEITVLQVNEQLARLPGGVTPEQLDPATRRIIGSLVNQQLLVQQAIEHKLDRDPDVLGALEAARLNILAQAYVQRVISPQAKPTDEEVRKYYADNPALFSDRKVYRLQELSFDAAPEAEKQVEAVAGAMKSLKELAVYMREKKIPFAADIGVRKAEQLPMAHLAQIAQLKPGQVLVFPVGGNHASAIEVLASELEPVDDKRAAPEIEQYLANRKREELALVEVKRLRDAAKIEYVGDFTKYAGDANAQAGAQPPTASAGDKTAASERDKGIAALH